MLNLVNRILVLIIVVGVVGLVYLLALIVKLFRMKLDEGKTQAPHPQASYSKQSEATPGPIEKPEEPEWDSDSATIVLAPRTVGHTPYARLKFASIAGEKTYREELVFRKRTSVGRDDDIDIAINDPMVSRYHADLIFQDGDLYLIDRGKNGTLLNGTRIPALSKVLIPDRSYIQIGNSAFVVEKTGVQSEETYAEC